LITREPVGFLLDLGRFHQRSHHFLSLFSLSKYGEFSSALLCVFGALEEEKKGREEEKKIKEESITNKLNFVLFYI
jgi:hypothetical protein